jgi:hypothetical protein
VQVTKLAAKTALSKQLSSVCPEILKGCNLRVYRALVSTIQQPPKQPTSALANQLSELPTFSSTKFFSTFLIHSVFSATLLLSITALFREPKVREDLQLYRALVNLSYWNNSELVATLRQDSQN